VPLVDLDRAKANVSLNHRSRGDADISFRGFMMRPRINPFHDIIYDVYTIIDNDGPRALCCIRSKKLSRVLGRVYDAAHRHFADKRHQLAYLRCIDRRKGEPLMRVAAIEMDRSSLYRALDTMVRDEWLKRSAAAEKTRARDSCHHQQRIPSPRERWKAVGKVRPAWSNG